MLGGLFRQQDQAAAPERRDGDVMKWAIRSLAGAAGLLVVAVLAGVVIQGPVTTWRVLRYGDTTIYDYKLYPFRPLVASKEPFPLRGQPVAEPGKVDVHGLGEVDLERFLDGSDTIAFLAIRGDALVLERYFHGHGATGISQAFSTSKSVISILVGVAIDDGLIGSANDPVTAYVPELSARGFDGVRLVDLLQMRSGMDYVENDNPYGIHVRFNFTPHLEDEILALRHSGGPQDRFIYKSGDNALLALVLKRALKRRTITQYTQERLWQPLGMEHDGLWSLDRENGFERSWCCLSATARDLAKFGMLYRDGGLWRGRQVVSNSWIDDSTRKGGYSPEEWRRSDVSPGLWNYGYQWWLADRERGDFLSIGKDGQYIYVDPQNDMVVVRLGAGLGTYQGRSLSVTDWIAVFQAVALKLALDGPASGD